MELSRERRDSLPGDPLDRIGHRWSPNSIPRITNLFEDPFFQVFPTVPSHDPSTVRLQQSDEQQTVPLEDSENAQRSDVKEILPLISQSSNTDIPNSSGALQESQESASIRSVFPPLARNENVRSDSLLSLSRASQPPRYSKELSGTWVDSAEGAFSFEENAKDGYRNSASSGISQSLSLFPPSYTSDEQHSHTSIKKRNSDSCGHTTRGYDISTDDVSSTLMEKQGRASFDDTLRRSRELVSLQENIDRLYSLTPRLDNQRAGAHTLEHNVAQREEEFEEMMRKMVTSGRMNDQRANPPPSTLSLASNNASVHSASFSSPQTTKKLHKKARRFPSMGHMSLRPLSVRRATSFLERTHSKEKEREIDTDLIESYIPAPSDHEAEKHHFREENLDACPSSSENDPMFDLLLHSNRRMINQDAVMQVPGGRPDANSTSHDHRSNGQVDGTNATKANAIHMPSSHQRATSLRSVHVDHEVHVKDHGTDSDLTHTPLTHFIAETQERLGTVSVTVWTENPKPHLLGPLEYQISAESPLDFVLSSNDLKKAFPLPVQVNPSCGLMSCDQSSNGWFIRLPMAAQESRKEPDIPMSASWLHLMSPRVLVCRNCKASLSLIEHKAKYVALPSHHWEELVDAWMCHTDLELNETIVNAQNDIEQHAGLQNGQIHVADNHLVMPHSTFLDDAVHTREQVSMR